MHNIRPTSSFAFRPSALCAWLAILASLQLTTGCNRTFFRRQADMEAYSLVREKANHPHWSLPEYSISIDPRSRMFDPHAIDCPPIPPDDQTAHQLMQCVDSKRGWPFWHDNGERGYVENPAWPEYLMTENGVMKLNTEDAVRLALLHSRTYQQQLETLYLSALDVSAQRFVFDTQTFAGYSIFGQWLGAFAPGSGGSPKSRLELSTFNNGGPRWTARRAFSSGSTLVVQFANSLLWQFAGPDDYRGVSVVDFAFIQPFLRDAGRDRILEPLTQAERTLLNNVRAMEQFRQGFYLNVVTGANTGVGPTRGGGAGQLAGGVTGGGSAPGGAGNFLGLVQSQGRIANQEDNVRRLERNLSRLSYQLDQLSRRFGLESSPVLTQMLQVAQARQALLSARTQLITLQNNYQSDLDSFKVDVLGLPSQICFEPAADQLQEFNLIDLAIIRLLEGWDATIQRHIEARVDIPERIQDSVSADTTGHVQTVEIEGNPTGGNYTLYFLDAAGQKQETVPLTFDASGEDVQTALRGLPGLASVVVASFGTAPNLRHLVYFGDIANPPPLATGGMLTPVAALVTVSPSCLISIYPELPADLELLRPALQEMYDFSAAIVEQHLPTIHKDIDLFKEAIPKRQARLERLIQRVEELQESRCELLPLLDNPLASVGGGPKAANLIARIEASLAKRELDYGRVSQNFKRYADSLAKRGQIADQLRQELKGKGPDDLSLFEKAVLFEQLVREIYDARYECPRTQSFTFDVAEAIQRELPELQILQGIARSESIELPEISIQSEQALEVARKYRRDWMNARAQLVDGWRQIQFTSDQLQSSFDLIFNGDVRNLGDNPFNFRSTTGTLRAGVQFDAPLTRLLERNAYRTALINYQQARRNYYRFEDQVGQLLRDHLRSLITNEINLEFQILAVDQAGQQVVLNNEIENLSQIAAQAQGASASTRATAARDAVQAIQDLLTALNATLGTRITLKVLYMSLDFNLGTMQLDEEGLWKVPTGIGQEYGQFDPWLGITAESGAQQGGNHESLPPANQVDPVSQLPPAFLLPTPNAPLLEVGLDQLLPAPPLPGNQGR